MRPGLKLYHVTTVNSPEYLQYLKEQERPEAVYYQNVPFGEYPTDLTAPKWFSVNCPVFYRG